MPFVAPPNGLNLVMIVRVEKARSRRRNLT